MGLLSVDLLITLQILPVFFSNCLFLALYDSVILLKHMVLFLSRSKSGRGEWRRMLTSEGLRCVWNSFLLDAYKQVGTRGWGLAGWGDMRDIPVVNGEGKGMTRWDADCLLFHIKFGGRTVNWQKAVLLSWGKGFTSSGSCCLSALPLTVQPWPCHLV